MLKTLKKWRFALIGILISALAVGFFVTQVDLVQFGDALRSARVVYLIPVAVLIIAGLMVRAVRWRRLLGNGLPYWRTFHILNVAYFANGILPLRLGELARAYLAAQGKPSIPAMKTLSTVVVERLLDVLAVLLLMGLALPFTSLPDALRAPTLLFIPFTIAGFTILVALSATRDRAMHWIGLLAARTGIDRRINVTAFAGQFLDGLQPLTQPSAFAGALLLTAGSWAFSVASGYVLMLAFYPQADIAATLLFTAAASFAVAVPAVPGNLGTYEASIWVGLAAMGYGEPLATATAFAITIHGMNLLINTVLGGIGLYAEGVSLGQLTRGVRAMNVRAEAKTH